MERFGGTKRPETICIIKIPFAISEFVLHPSSEKSSGVAVRIGKSGFPVTLSGWGWRYSRIT